MRNLRRHEPLGLLYRWPPNAGEAHAASQAPHQSGELLRLLAVDSNGRPVWESFEEMAGEVGAGDVEDWARASKVTEYFSEPEITDEDRRLNANLRRLRGEGEVLNADAGEIRDVKSWERLSPFQQMVAQLSLGFHLNPESLMRMDYAMLRGMLAKASIDQRVQKARSNA